MKGIFSIEAEYFRPSFKEGGRRLGASGYKEFTITAGDRTGNALFRIANQRPWLE